MNRNFELGTRPALTMSVPVRYSAAANYAVVDSGLSNTLQQEEQHHIQLQQQQQQFQIFQHQQQQHQQLYNSYSGLELNYQQQHYEQQQQLMQQRSSMSSSVSVSGTSSSTSSSSSSSQLPIISTVNPIISVVNSKSKNKKKNKKMLFNQQQQKHHPKQQQKSQQKHHAKHPQQQQQQQLKHKPLLVGSGTSIIPASAFKPSMNAAVGMGRVGGRGGAFDDDDMKPTTSAMAAAARAAATASATTAAAVAAAATVQSVATAADEATIANAEMRTEWMRMSDGGRFGTPGAAGLEYQKQQQLALLEQQQQQQTINTIDQPMEPSLMDNEMTSGTATPADGSNAGVDDNTMDDMNSTPAISQNFIDQLNAITSEELYNTLKEYDALQDKYHTVLLLPKDSRREVTAGGRDGSAYVLRCLKMWYELPSDVLFSAMSLVDRFLDRMAVKPKHMACMSVASFHLAIKQLDLKPIPADDLVTISQCGCTAGDLERMAGVIANKLGVQMMTGQAPITSVSYLRIYYALFRNLAKDIGGQFFEFFQQLIKLEDLENRLEILLCDVKTTVITPSTLALVLICLHLDFHIKESYTRGSPELKHVFEYILFLQQYMRIPDRVFTCGFSIVSGILSHYNGQNKQPYKQRLVWKLSSRTLRVLRPTNRFSSDLPTIDEGIPNAMDDGLRSRTESISSEEEEDWPTSAIIPIFEQC